MSEKWTHLLWTTHNFQNFYHLDLVQHKNIMSEKWTHLLRTTHNFQNKYFTSIILVQHKSIMSEKWTHLLRTHIFAFLKIFSAFCELSSGQICFK